MTHHDGNGAPRKGRRTLVVVLRFWTRVAVLGLAGAIVIGHLGGVWSPFDLAAHFQVQYFIAAAAGVVLCLLLRSRRWAILPGLCLIVTGWQVLPWYVPSGSTAVEARASASTGSAIRILLANVRTTNRRHEAVIALIDRWRPDVVVLQEVNARWLEAMEPIRARLPHAVTAPRPDNFGVAVYSRRPLEGARTVYLGPAEVDTIIGVLNIDGARATLIASHPVPPIGRRNAALRDAQLEAIAETVAGLRGPVLVVGDLNATMWSAPFERLIEETGLRNARRGFGILPSWPAALPAFARIPIDHCLCSGDIEVKNCLLGEPTGSDHRPVVVDLILPAASEDGSVGP
ncbi:MAG: endonuclease/exonuclease/phosphatase family protein [Planctomycetota bacterium]|nr:endonuclease/exonuclease/phosphatase family protein [Planctomycetota bacterium]